MNVCVTGSMGYIGFPTVIKLLRAGHVVIGIDNNFRDGAVKISGSESIIPIHKVKQRKKAANGLGKYIHVDGDITDFNLMKRIFEEYRIDFIIHLAAQPSAPYSMIDNATAEFTQTKNNEGTMNILWCMRQYAPKSTLIFASTMGIYGQPPYRIPHDGLLDEPDPNTGNLVKVPVPYMGGSFYHLSKTLDEQNILFASKQWGLKSLILRQGVVFGNVLRNNEGVTDSFLNAYPTRFDIDKYFGTAFNRFVAQAIMGYGITLYGKGQQTRAFVTLNHAVDDLVSPILGKIDEDWLKGSKILNSVTKCFNLTELATTIKKVVEENLPIRVDIRHVDNPRKEKEENDLIMEQPDRELSLDMEIRTIINNLKPHMDRLEKYKESIL